MKYLIYLIFVFVSQFAKASENADCIFRQKKTVFQKITKTLFDRNSYYSFPNWTTYIYKNIPQHKKYITTNGNKLRDGQMSRRNRTDMYLQVITNRKKRKNFHRSFNRTVDKYAYVKKHSH